VFRTVVIDAGQYTALHVKGILETAIFRNDFHNHLFKLALFCHVQCICSQLKFYNTRSLI